MGIRFSAIRGVQPSKKKGVSMKKVLCVVTMMVLTLGLGACSGGSDGTDSTDSTDSTVSISSLTDIPDAQDMFKTNSAASASLIPALKAVSGTPPLLTSITPANADTYFWNGAAAAIAGGTATPDQENAFWGEMNGEPAGEVACRMAQTTGYTMQGILQSATSLCYMKGMPDAIDTGGVSDNTLGITPSNVFDKLAADKLIKVTTNGQDENMGGGDMNVFITVYGSDTVGSDVYKVQLYTCSLDSDTAKQATIITANTSSSAVTVGGTEIAGNTMTIVDLGTDTGEEEGTSVYSSTVSGKLKTASDGSITFDEAADRSALFGFSQGDNLDKSSVLVDADNQITTKDYWIGTYGNDNANTNKVYAIIGFTGENGLTDLRFTEAGVNGVNTSGGNDYEFSGGAEYNEAGYYVTNSSSAYATTVADYGFDTDSFFDDAPTAPSTTSLADYDCSATADADVDMDLTQTAVAAVASACESKMLSNMDFCNSETISDARQALEGGS